MDPKEIDEASQKIATHPRISLQEIEAAMAGAYFVTADRLIVKGEGTFGDPDRDMATAKVMTLCIVVMKNGFVVIGKTAPASPENFDAEIGRKFSYDDAVKQLWPLMGYSLRDKLEADRAMGQPHRGHEEF